MLAHRMVGWKAIEIRTKIFSLPIKLRMISNVITQIDESNHVIKFYFEYEIMIKKCMN